MRGYPTVMDRLAPWLVWGVLVLILLAGAVLLLVFGGPGVFIAVVIIMLMIASVLAFATWRAMRMTRQRAFLLMMAESIERRIPLIPALQAFGAEYGTWAGRTRRLAGALANGMVLSDALRLFPGTVPVESLPLVEAGQKSGRLAEAMRRAADQNDRSTPIWQSLTGKIFYLCMVLLFMLGIWTFIAIKIIPAFVQIFDDFGCQLPWLTQQMVGVMSLVYQFWPLMWFLAMGLAALFIYGSLCYVGLLTCDLPGTRWITRRLDTATVLDALAISTDAGRPMPEALTALVSHYPRRSIRRRLRRMWYGVAEGRDWCESLAACRLVRAADAGVLQSAARAGNLPWAMRELADSNRRRFAYRLSAILQIVFPITLCAVGLVVGTYVTACFLPLIHLIRVLT